ncbi:hypothetical protein AALP_AA8G340400 [Arabis alpina]|uniref:WRKY domain-containing protein n=1 Tax=Arabis alpina TaxID=50452 RepID=A0A087GB88_ARAAL|nr:hypothetical protein AALP_AA8G340400 [Arabis alpina]
MDPNRKDFRVDSDCGGGGGARYKLMSPAKLPITRSTCITIPPGLSPTSFLESPVLLSNIKAEPSPTTGSLFKPQAVHANSSSYTARTIHQSILDEQKSSEFEFRPPASNMFYAELDKHRNEAPLQFQSQGHNFKHSSSEAAASSSEINRQTVPHRTTPSGSERSDPDESIQTTQTDSRGSAPAVLADDGYNWRKYGQKHVKGSEFPRSYYKCTHPNCEVKKLFERSHDGQITEIIYKGTHDHPKPQPSRRNSGGLVMPAQEERLDKYPSLNGRDEKGSSFYNLSPPVEQNGNPDVSPVSANEDGGDVAMSNRNNDDMDNNDPFSKRRRLDGAMEITPLVKPIREPRVVVQTLSEVDILDDGYRWRKYGQKVVRGNPNPRSYYKCTATGCPVRKHVERASHDPKAVITTYEGKHDHDVPTARSNNNNNNHDMPVPRFRPEETTDTISLDLGVGISSGGPDNTSNEHPNQQQQHHIRSEFVHQSQTNGAAGFRFVHGPPMGSYYTNSLNAGMNHQYNSSRETGNGSQTGDISSSYTFPHNIGRIQTGP